MNPEIEVAKWDSEFFNYKVGRVFVPAQCNAEWLAGFADGVVQQAHVLKFRLVYAFAEMPLAGFVQESLARSGFRDVGGKREYVKALSAVPHAGAEAVEISICREASPPVVRLALQSGEQSRYRVDPGFVADEYERLFSEWIGKSVTGVGGSWTFILGSLDMPLGLITLDAHGDAGRIGLLAVDANSRRLGIGRKLVDHVLSFASERGIKKIHVSTQCGNRAACDLYERCGFQVVSDTAIFHLWVD